MSFLGIFGRVCDSVKIAIYGNNVVVNGDFGVDANWTEEVGWTIASGVAHSDGTQATVKRIYQGCLTVGKKYLVGYSISNLTGVGSCNIGSSTNIVISGVGSFISIKICSGTGNLEFSAGSGVIFDVDNVVVKEVKYMED